VRVFTNHRHRESGITLEAQHLTRNNIRSRSFKPILSMSDLDTLVDMGFDRERSEFAVKQAGGRKYVLFAPCLMLTFFSAGSYRLA